MDSRLVDLQTSRTSLDKEIKAVNTIIDGSKLEIRNKQKSLFDLGEKFKQLVTRFDDSQVISLIYALGSQEIAINAYVTNKKTESELKADLAEYSTIIQNLSAMMDSRPAAEAEAAAAKTIISQLNRTIDDILALKHAAETHEEKLKLLSQQSTALDQELAQRYIDLGTTPEAYFAALKMTSKPKPLPPTIDTTESIYVDLPIFTTVPTVSLDELIKQLKQNVDAYIIKNTGDDDESDDINKKLRKNINRYIELINNKPSGDHTTYLRELSTIKDTIANDFQYHISAEVKVINEILDKINGTIKAELTPTPTPSPAPTITTTSTATMSLRDHAKLLREQEFEREQKSLDPEAKSYGDTLARETKEEAENPSILETEIDPEAPTATARAATTDETREDERKPENRDKVIEEASYQDETAKINDYSAINKKLLAEIEARATHHNERAAPLIIEYVKTVTEKLARSNFNPKDYQPLNDKLLADIKKAGSTTDVKLEELLDDLVTNIERHRDAFREAEGAGLETASTLTVVLKEINSRYTAIRDDLYDESELTPIPAAKRFIVPRLLVSLQGMEKKTNDMLADIAQATFTDEDKNRIRHITNDLNELFGRNIPENFAAFTSRLKMLPTLLDTPKATKPSSQDQYSDLIADLKEERNQLRKELIDKRQLTVFGSGLHTPDNKRKQALLERINHRINMLEMMEGMQELKNKLPAIEAHINDRLEPSEKNSPAANQHIERIQALFDQAIKVMKQSSKTETIQYADTKMIALPIQPGQSVQSIYDEYQKNKQLVSSSKTVPILMGPTTNKPNENSANLCILSTPVGDIEYMNTVQRGTGVVTLCKLPRALDPKLTWEDAYQPLLSDDMKTKYGFANNTNFKNLAAVLDQVREGLSKYTHNDVASLTKAIITEGKLKSLHYSIHNFDAFAAELANNFHQIFKVNYQPDLKHGFRLPSDFLIKMGVRYVNHIREVNPNKPVDIINSFSPAFLEAMMMVCRSQKIPMIFDETRFPNPPVITDKKLQAFEMLAQEQNIYLTKDKPQEKVLSTTELYNTLVDLKVIPPSNNFNNN